MALNILLINLWLLIPAAVVGLYLLYRWLCFKPLPGIPYNKNAAGTLMGDIPEMIKVIEETGSVWEWLSDQTIKHNSPIVQIFNQPFRRPWIVLTDFKETQDILLRRPREFDRSETTADVFGGVAPQFHISFKSDNEAFKTHRALIKDLMTPAFLNQVAAPQIHAHVSNLVKIWSLKAQLSKTRPFNAFDDVFDIMMDSISAVTFGLNIDDSVTTGRINDLIAAGDASVQELGDGAVDFYGPERPALYEALRILVDSVSAAVKSPLPVLEHFYLRQKSTYRKAHRLKEELIDVELKKGVARVQAGDVTQRCALDNVVQRELTAASKANRPVNWKSRAIRDELFGFLVAGYETTSSTMVWGFKSISANPEVQQTLRSHLRDAFPAATSAKRDPTYDEITKSHIPYLDATIEEIHRFSSIFSMTIRRAQVDTTILGCHVPKGTDIAMTSIGPSYHTTAFEIPDHLRSESFRAAKHQVGSFDPEDTKSFKPERWLRRDDSGHEVFDATSGPLMVFALGPRACYGRRLAYLQMRILLVLTLWNLEFLRVEGQLGSFEAVEKLAKIPVYTWLSLKEIAGQDLMETRSDHVRKNLTLPEKR